MRRNVLFACLIALCASLTGFEPARASTQVDDTDGSNLFVVLGGNGTCRRRVMSPVVPGLINAKLFDAFKLPPSIVHHVARSRSRGTFPGGFLLAGFFTRY